MEKTENENRILIDSEKLFAFAINNYLNENGANWKINCYMVWDFTHQTKNDNEFYYIKFDEELFNTFKKDLHKNRLLIPSKFCKSGFENLMTELIDIIPQRNLL